MAPLYTGKKALNCDSNDVGAFLAIMMYISSRFLQVLTSPCVTLHLHTVEMQALMQILKWWNSKWYNSRTVFPYRPGHSFRVQFNQYTSVSDYAEGDDTFKYLRPHADAKARCWLQVDSCSRKY